MNAILDKSPTEIKAEFAENYAKLFGLDQSKVVAEIKANAVFKPLTELWYQHLDNNDINSAYSVYDAENYYVDIIHCFLGYSRRYLRDLYKPKMPNGESFVDMTKNAKCVVDIGCGVSYSTAALKYMYPDADVYGINLKDTKQWKFCEDMGRKHNFSMIEHVKELPTEIDVLFASEYFEHILDPITHIQELCDISKPKYLVIANAFNTWSIGHFSTYNVKNDLIPQEKASKMFNDELRTLGYTKLKTSLFNNKPNIWKRND